MKTENKDSTMFRELSIEKTDTTTNTKEDRTVELSFSSEAPYNRYFGPEILSHDKDAVDLSRLEEIGVLLFNHDSYTPIGRVISTELDEADRKCKAVVSFDEDDESEKIYQKVQSGSLKGVSVGYRVSVWEEVDAGAMSTDGKFAGPCSIATRWMPYEISIVSVPADASVGVGRSENILATQEIEGNEERMETSKNENKHHQEPPNQISVPDNVNSAVQRALEEERGRVNEITSMCRSFGMKPDDYITDAKSIEEVRKIVLDKVAMERKPTKISVGVEESEKFRLAAADGLAMRAGVNIDKPAEGAEDFKGKRMLRLAGECIERETGKSTRNYSDEDLVREALTGSGAFPGILSNVANKSMAQAYATAPTTYQLWTGKGSNSDFKDATRYRLSEADELEKMTEQGEFKSSKVTEASVKTSIATYGKSFSITRQAIINDDLGALNQIPAKYGAAARRMINKMVYKIVADNPSIEKAALFHTDHKNIGTGILSVKSLGTAKAQMAKQTNVAGKEKLNIQPAFLLVPVELEVDAIQLISSVVDPTKANATPNPFANKLSVVADPEIEAIAPWYLAAAPGLCPTIEVTYLNGKEAPTMESAIQFDTLGVKWRVYLDVGVNLLDFRGLFKSTGE